MAPGNSFTTAQNIGTLTSFAITESINDTSSLDFYKFTLTGPRDVVLQVDSTSQGSLVSEIFIDRNNNGLIDAGEKLYFSSGIGAGGIGGISTALGAGTYYASVWRSTLSTNTSYRLQMVATSINSSFATDPGNSLSTAHNLGTLSGIQQIKDFVGSTDTFDYYKFSLTGTNDIKVSLSGVRDDYLDTRIYQDRNNNGIAEAGELLYFAETNSSTEINESLGAGTYFIEIRGQGYSKPFANVNSTYSLLVAVNSSGTSLPVDPGNNLSTAYNLGVLSGSRQIKEFVGSVDAYDYYKFSLTGTNDIKVALSGVRDDYLDTRIYQDRNNNGIAETGELLYFAETNGSTEINESLGAGTYFIEIRGQGYSKPFANVNSTYSLLVAANSSGTSFPVEPGNTLATAHNLGTLSGIQQIKEFVGSVDAFDYYKFSLTGTNDIKVALSGVKDDYLDTRIYQDRNNNGIAEAGELLYFAETNASTEINESLGAGTYFIEIRGQGYSKPFANVNSTYSLLVAVNPNPPSIPIDPGNTLSTAYNIGELRGIQQFQEFVGSSDIVDYYKFSLTSTSSIKLVLSGIKDDYMDVRIGRDANNNGVIDATEVLFYAEANNSKEINASLGTGNYFVQVTPQGYSKAAINVNSTYDLLLVNNTFPSFPNTVSLTATSVDEDGPANLIYTFTRTGSAASALTVAYSATGTAGFGSDYGLGSISNFNGTTGTITFAAGSNQATLILDPKADGTIEANETVALSLVAGSGYTIGTATPVIATIRNDDQANRSGVMLSVRDAAVVEGRDRVAVITIDLDIASSQPISVSYTTTPINGTVGVDYTPVTGILTIPANSRTATLEVPIINDALNEGDESFIVTFTNPVNATLDPERSSSEVVISDTLRSSITRVLSTGVENLLLTGINPTSGTGNAGNNTITGNSAGNYLTGRGGNDILIGGTGSDIYVIDADIDFGSDTITEAIGGGSDTLDLRSTSRAVTIDLGSSLLQTLAAGVQVTFVGGTIENAYGGAGNDVLKGNALGNNLMGNVGNDQLQGLGGADNFYYLGAALTGANTVATAFGRDTIADFAVGVDKFVLSKTAFTAIASAGVPLASFASVANDGLVAAQTAVIVYSQGSGNLFYNQNGLATGLGTGGNFAVLANRPLNLTATDFSIVA